ncbi:MAG: GAF domain-containing protein [Chloroflexaceae bacterium]|nr:GAF domain-containing protein [Chloroflexaceae bacterium]
MQRKATLTDEDEMIFLRQRVCELEQMERRLQRRNDEMDALYQTTLAMMHRLDMSDVFQAILTRSGQLSHARDGYVCLVDSNRQVITFVEGVGLFTRFIGVQMKKNEGLTGRVWQAEEPIIIDDYDTWFGNAQQFVESGIKAIVGVPLIRDAQVIGVLGLANPQSGRTFDQETIRLLEQFAPLAAITLENARLYTAMQQQLEERTRTQEVIAAQAETLRKLSSPLIPISDHVMIMPLIGTIDEQRAGQIMETLLIGVQQRRAAVVILDTTGIEVIDTQIANVLLQAAQAARLLGARVVLSGVQPRIAQTLVELGIDLSQIVTHRTLQASIAYASAGHVPSQRPLVV